MATAPLGAPMPVASSASTAPKSASIRRHPTSPPPASRPPAEKIKKGGGELASLGAPVPPRTGELVGLAPATVAAFLGPPGFKRHDDPAEIWRYAAGSCFLDLFLYKRGGRFAVMHVEARSKSVVKVSTDDCLRDVFNVRNRGDSG